VANRELLYQLTIRDIRIRYKQAVMGIAWAILTPLVVALSGWVLRWAFGRLAGAPPPDAVMAGIAVKAVAWSFFVGSLGFATASITANLPLVTKVYFPREMLPLASVITQLVDLGVAAVALVVVLPFFDVGVSAALVWLFPLVAILVLISTGVGLLASCANVFFRDAKYLVQLVVSFGIFFTPVFVDVDLFGPLGSRLAMLNPLAPVFEGLRLVIVQGHDLRIPIHGADGALVWSPGYLGLAATVGLVALVAGTTIFRRAEFDFAEYV